MKLFGADTRYGHGIFKERRKAERVSTIQTLWVDYRSPIHLNSGSGEGKDLSTCGIRFACYSHYPVGTPLDLKLRIRRDEYAEKIVQVHTFVVRCYRKTVQRRYRIACSFSRIDPPALKEISTFVAWVKAKNANPFLQ